MNRIAREELYEEGCNLKDNARNILVVEDDICLSHIIEKIFKSLDPDMTITWVYSAEAAALKLEEEQNFSLIVADYTLTGKETGLDLWDRCVRLHPDIPFIMVSSLTVDMFFKLIGTHRISPPFLPKPFYTGEFKQLVESLLHH
jgi:DNA-binding NtrC family response regulator